MKSIRVVSNVDKLIQFGLSFVSITQMIYFIQVSGVILENGRLGGDCFAVLRGLNAVSTTSFLEDVLPPAVLIAQDITDQYGERSRLGSDFSFFPPLTNHSRG